MQKVITMNDVFPSSQRNIPAIPSSLPPRSPSSKTSKNKENIPKNQYLCLTPDSNEKEEVDEIELSYKNL